MPQTVYGMRGCFVGSIKRSKSPPKRGASRRQNELALPLAEVAAVYRYSIASSDLLHNLLASASHQSNGCLDRAVINRRGETTMMAITTDEQTSQTATA